MCIGLELAGTMSTGAVSAAYDAAPRTFFLSHIRRRSFNLLRILFCSKTSHRPFTNILLNFNWLRRHHLHRKRSITIFFPLKAQNLCHSKQAMLHGQILVTPSKAGLSVHLSCTRHCFSFRPLHNKSNPQTEPQTTTVTDTNKRYLTKMIRALLLEE